MVDERARAKARSRNRICGAWGSEHSLCIGSWEKAAGLLAVPLAVRRIDGADRRDDSALYRANLGSQGCLDRQRRICSGDDGYRVSANSRRKKAGTLIMPERMPLRNLLKKLACESSLWYDNYRGNAASWDAEEEKGQCFSWIRYRKEGICSRCLPSKMLNMLKRLWSGSAAKIYMSGYSSGQILN